MATITIYTIDEATFLRDLPVLESAARAIGSEDYEAFIEARGRIVATIDLPDMPIEELRVHVRKIGLDQAFASRVFRAAPRKPPFFGLIRRGAFAETRKLLIGLPGDLSALARLCVTLDTLRGSNLAVATLSR